MNNNKASSTGRFFAVMLAVLGVTGLAGCAGCPSECGRKDNMKDMLDARIVRLSIVTVDPNRLDEYMKFAAECGKTSMREEPGVLMMYSMQDKLQPNKISILEIYADRAAYERHIKTAHFQKYKQGTLSMVQKLELLDQNALIPEMMMKEQKQ